MYKAKCYVRYKGKTYEPGECIPNDLSPEEVIWLNKAGAIEEVAPAVPVEEELPFVDVVDGVVQPEPEKPKKSARGRRKAK